MDIMASMPVSSGMIYVSINYWILLSGMAMAGILGYVVGFITGRLSAFAEISRKQE